MSKEEVTNKLVRLNNILHEAKEIIMKLEEHVNGRMLADCPEVTIFELMSHTGSKQVRFDNAARAYGVATIRDLIQNYTQEDCLRWRNVGEGCVSAAATALKEKYGIIW